MKTSYIQEHHAQLIGGDQAFSSDPEKRGIEVDFFSRMISTVKLAGERALFLANSDRRREETVISDLSAMQNPFFEKIAEEFEKNVPEQKGFGKFRSRG